MNDLPSTIQPFAELIGRSAALKLAEAPDNSRRRGIYIPKSTDRLQKIEAVIGPKKARLLCAEFGGMNLTLAKGTSIKRLARDKQIALKRKQGATLSEIEQEYGVGKRTVYYALQRQRRHLKRANKPTPGTLSKPTPLIGSSCMRTEGVRLTSSSL